MTPRKLLKQILSFFQERTTSMEQVDKGLNGHRNQPIEETSKDILNDIRAMMHDMLAIQQGQQQTPQVASEGEALTEPAVEVQRLEGKYDPNHENPSELFPTHATLRTELRKLYNDMSTKHNATWGALAMLLGQKTGVPLKDTTVMNYAGTHAIRWNKKHKFWSPQISEERGQALLDAVREVRGEWLA